MSTEVEEETLLLAFFEYQQSVWDENVTSEQHQRFSLYLHRNVRYSK